MRERKVTADRLAAFSDAVIAVIITIMVLELKAPESASFAALLPLWPTAIGYAVSYLFIAIVWVNHHHLFGFIDRVTARLIWINFAHLFFVALVPFATSWMARTQLASAPVTVYAAIFVCVNLAYRFFEGEVIAQADDAVLCLRMRRMARRRSLTTLLMFIGAMIVALVAPWVGFATICAALFLYLRPEVPGARA
ncbi:MAG TPA: TMEM175 family protein [Dyella sp.]|uniref:TMEM175 family protein n=1 Tax=Dyella sp. TaxID=1869338 RepID=UPI002F92B870